MSTQTMWLLFGVIITATLLIDLGVFNRKVHEVKTKEALIWTAVWILLAGFFTVLVYFWHGQDAALEFTTGYLIEKALSVDNLFVFLLIFSHFRVPVIYQHKILFWGILGAIVMRALFIGLGVSLIEKFHFIIYIFGALLVYSGVRMIFQKGEEIDLEKSMIVRLTKRFLPVLNNYHQGRFIVRIDGKTYITLLSVTLLIVEASDLVFAIDSIPAVLSISRDPFIVYTSNIFAILGLRSLYFALAGVMNYFHYLKYGLAFILCFIGFKMFVSGFYHVSVGVSLLVIGIVLFLSVVASLIWPIKTSENLKVKQ